MCVFERARHIGCGSCSHVAAAAAMSRRQHVKVIANPDADAASCSIAADAAVDATAMTVVVPHESQKLETDLKLEMPQTRRSCDSALSLSSRCLALVPRQQIVYLPPSPFSFLQVVGV